MRSKLERRRIVEKTQEPGASVAVIARANGVNANQVFYWRKLYREGRLEMEPSSTELLPVRISDEGCKTRYASEPKAARGPLGVIHIELGSVRVRIEGAADPNAIRRRAGRSSPVIALPTGTNIWDAAGVTDMRRGFTGLNHRLDESPASYSSPGWSPPGPDSASQASLILKYGRISRKKT